MLIIAGPCVIWNEEHLYSTGARIQEVLEKNGLNWVLKASYDKANRSKLNSYRGPGFDEGFFKNAFFTFLSDEGSTSARLSNIKKKYGIPGKKILKFYHLLKGRVLPRILKDGKYCVYENLLHPGMKKYLNRILTAVCNHWFSGNLR